jgi:hypothetical protein
MRHNRTQAEIGESFDVSQPTISRAISAITRLLAEQFWYGREVDGQPARRWGWDDLG